jgi:elongation factor Tu
MALTPGSVHVAVLGQKGHGRSSLVAALAAHAGMKHTSKPDPTNWDASRCTTAQRSYLLFDGRWHREVVLGILGGDTVPSIALVVVRATNPSSSELREQIRLVQLLGVEHVVGFVNWSMAEADTADVDRTEFDLRLELAEHGYRADDLTIVRGDIALAQRWAHVDRSVAACFDELLAALDACAVSALPPLEERPFLMPIEDVFHIRGRGVVATGQIRRGQVRPGDTVERVGLGANRELIVSSVETFVRGVLVASGPANVGMLFRGGITREDLETGQVLAAPGSIRASTSFEAVIRLHPPEEGGRQAPGFPGYRPQVYLHGYDGSGSLTPMIPGVDLMLPGGVYPVRVELMSDHPRAVEPGFAFGLREGHRSVGAGMITRVPG